MFYLFQNKIGKTHHDLRMFPAFQKRRGSKQEQDILELQLFLFSQISSDGL